MPMTGATASQASKHLLPKHLHCHPLHPLPDPSLLHHTPQTHLHLRAQPPRQPSGRLEQSTCHCDSLSALNGECGACGQVPPSNNDVAPSRLGVPYINSDTLCNSAIACPAESYFIEGVLFKVKVESTIKYRFPSLHPPTSSLVNAILAKWHTLWIHGILLICFARADILSRSSEDGSQQVTRSTSSPPRKLSLMMMSSHYAQGASYNGDLGQHQISPYEEQRGMAAHYGRNALIDQERSRAWTRQVPGAGHSQPFYPSQDQMYPLSRAQYQERAEPASADLASDAPHLHRRMVDQSSQRALGEPRPKTTTPAHRPSPHHPHSSTPPRPPAPTHHPPPAAPRARLPAVAPPARASTRTPRTRAASPSSATPPTSSSTACASTSAASGAGSPPTSTTTARTPRRGPLPPSTAASRATGRAWLMLLVTPASMPATTCI
ncbi:hypothetical protein FH972_021604 [Carpinus fangiana]|uniref:Uncharacterized protein n=1 Tax=Carpinus fangiana TaxID=176857 RepID=A0A5N6KQ58_9ROSI|nr:hypothetical protein FH972_021604 [Carpinus fangiana]